MDEVGRRRASCAAMPSIGDAQCVPHTHTRMPRQIPRECPHCRIRLSSVRLNLAEVAFLCKTCPYPLESDDISAFVCTSEPEFAEAASHSSSVGPSCESSALGLPSKRPSAAHAPYAPSSHATKRRRLSSQSEPPAHQPPRQPPLLYLTPTIPPSPAPARAAPSAACSMGQSANGMRATARRHPPGHSVHVPRLPHEERQRLVRLAMESPVDVRSGRVHWTANTRGAEGFSWLHALLCVVTHLRTVRSACTQLSAVGASTLGTPMPSAPSVDQGLGLGLGLGLASATGGEWLMSGIVRSFECAQRIYRRADTDEATALHLALGPLSMARTAALEALRDRVQLQLPSASAHDLAPAVRQLMGATSACGVRQTRDACSGAAAVGPGDANVGLCGEGGRARDTHALHKNLTCDPLVDFTCDGCGALSEARPRRQHVISLPHAPTDFSIARPSFVSRCRVCGGLCQRASIVFERVGDCIIAAFPTGVAEERTAPTTTGGIKPHIASCTEERCPVDRNSTATSVERLLDDAVIGGRVFRAVAVVHVGSKGGLVALLRVDGDTSGNGCGCAVSAPVTPSMARLPIDGAVLAMPEPSWIECDDRRSVARDAGGAFPRNVTPRSVRLVAWEALQLAEADSPVPHGPCVQTDAITGSADAQARLFGSRGASISSPFGGDDASDLLPMEFTRTPSPPPIGGWEDVTCALAEDVLSEFGLSPSPVPDNRRSMSHNGSDFDAHERLVEDVFSEFGLSPSPVPDHFSSGANTPQTHVGRDMSELSVLDELDQIQFAAPSPTANQ